MRYDHDFLESSASRKKEPTIEDLIHGHSYDDSFCEVIVAAAKKKRVKGANAAIIIYDFEFDPARPVCSQTAHRLHGKVARRAKFRFIGSAPYKK